MADLRVAVIGCGGHAQEHFRQIATDSRVHLSAIAEIDADRLEKSRVRWRPDQAFTEWRRMLDECDLDMVHICTMPGHILPIALDCLQRGLHTSIEKPPGMSSADTEKMTEMARLSKGKNIVSFDRRYTPEVLAVRRMVDERGGPVHCATSYNKNVDRIGSRAFAHLMPEAILCDGIHHVDLLRWLAGAALPSAAIPTAVYAEVQDGERDATNRQNAVVRFDSGAIGVLMNHSGVGTRIRRAEVHAEDFSAYLDLPPGETSYELFEAVEGDADGFNRGAPYEGELDLEPTGGPNFNETRHFIDCIIQDQTPWSTLDDAIHTMRLAEAIRRGHKGEVQ
jgi:predicted dehydrogenase